MLLVALAVVQIVLLAVLVILFLTNGRSDLKQISVERKRFGPS